MRGKKNNNLYRSESSVAEPKHHCYMLDESIAKCVLNGKFLIVLNVLRVQNHYVPHNNINT